MTLPTKQELAAAMSGCKTTDGWDVLVSYSEGPLNTLLKEKWGKHMTASYVFSVPYDDMDDGDDDPHLVKKHTHFDLKLSEPRLQFDSAIGDGFAILTMELDGHFYTVRDGEKPKRTHEIPHDTYQLEFSVPINVVKADETNSKKTMGQGQDVVVFNDDQVHSYSLVLHFKNKEASWNVKKKENTGRHPIDDQLPKVRSTMESRLLEDLEELDFRLAQVSNAKGNENDDTDYLRPRSFRFAATNGILHVFIRTKGSEGDDRPRFQHKESGKMLPIPSGSEASIIISNQLFSSFVTSQIKEKRGADVSRVVESTDSKDPEPGIKWSLYLNGDKTWNLGNDIGLRKYQIDTVSTSFNTHALVFQVCDDEQLVPRTSWDFYFTADVSWKSENDTAGVPDYRCGLTRITAELSKKGKQFGTLSGDTINLELDYDTTDKPVVHTKPLPTSGDGLHVPKMEIPDAFDGISFTLPSFKTKLTGLNFFSAQNVFVPGVRFIKATQVMVPHDVLLIGEMPRHEANQPSAAPPASAPAAMPGSLNMAANPFTTASPHMLATMPDAVLPPTTAPQDVEARAKSFLDKVYSDGYFLGDLMRAVADGGANDVRALLAPNGHDSLTEETLVQVLQDLTALGPKFDVRYAGGLYGPISGEESYFKQLVVHPVHRTIYVDGYRVKSQVQHPDGRITFESHDGNTGFEVLFHCEYNPNSWNRQHSFEGKAWPTSQPETSAISIVGNRVFPWSDSESSTAGAASTDTFNIDKHAYKSLVLALDLVNPTDEHRPAKPPASTMVLFAEPVTTTLTVIGGVVGFILSVWAFDKAVGEAATRWRERWRGCRKLIRRRNLNAIIKNFDVVKTTIETEKEMGLEMERVVNRSITNLTSLDSSSIMEKAKPEIDEAVAKFVYSLHEYMTRKRHESLYELCGKTTEEITVQTIVQNLNNVLDPEHYPRYVEAMVTRVVAENKKDQARRNLKSLGERIKKANEKIQELEGTRRILDGARVARANEKIKKEKLSPEAAKASVQREIDNLTRQIESQQEKLAQEQQDREANERIKQESNEEIERSKRTEKESRAKMWKKKEAAE